MVLNENNFIEALFNAMPFGVYVVDVKNYEIIYMNKKLIDAHDNLTGKICYEALYKGSRPCSFCKINDILNKDLTPNGKSICFNYFNEFEDHWYQMHEKAIKWSNGKIVKYSIAVDISELKDTQNSLGEAHAELALKNIELKVLSTTDKLTQISNRMKLDQVLKEEFKRSKRYKRLLSIIIFDIDDFKHVNDNFGHLAGDEVLKKLADTVKSQIRTNDTIGRWGGEEFLVISPELDHENAKKLAEKIRISIENLNFNHTQCTASFGVATMTDEKTISDLIKKSDRALYKAKANGKNQVCN